MAWITITTDDLKGRLTAPEFTAVGTAAKQVSQDATVIISEAITNTVRRVRGYVAACSKNTLGEGETIPDELMTAALALVRDHLFTRLPGLRSLNDELRQKETDRAMEDLRAVSACKFAIVSPETPALAQAGGPAIVLVSARKRIGKRSDTSGLF